MGEKSIRTAHLDRGIEQAIVALKKGSHLLKYGKRGKPKFCPFRLSSDEKVLIWYSGKEEKQLRLSSVTKIIPGQRTANFQRQPQPEKECQSFSLIYESGGQSLDLICKDKEQAEIWFVGLSILVARTSLSRSWAIPRHGTSCVNSPDSYTRKKHNLGFLEELDKGSLQVHLGSPHSLAERCYSNGSACSSDGLYSSGPRTPKMWAIVDTKHPEFENECHKEKKEPTSKPHSIIFSERIDSNCSTPSLWKNDLLRDVWMWGEGIEGGILGGGTDKFNTCVTRFDALLPKLLESTRMLDVHNISCGGKHASLVTKQGEVFCWGEGSGGRLGHKINMDVAHPKPVDSLANIRAQSIACGEYHTCALSVSGELYTWGACGGDIKGDVGIRISWLPRRVLGCLDGIFIESVACGEWHTAIISSSGQLFTFGDGTFGVLGHGNVESIYEPKEVESFRGSRVKSVACGSWHTAAIVEIKSDQSNENVSKGKLFTWGDGDKGRLGHAEKERKLFPACVVQLSDHDFIQVSCGRMLTVVLTVTGVVYTIGSSVHGQLGNPQAEDKSITVVEGRLRGEHVKEISAGSYHVAVLTSKGNVYTWGKGANGRLGLGDTDDRNSPTMIDSLKEIWVQSVVCGSSFTAAICLHKSVSSSDQSACNGCGMIFSFTRKKHNCYNCGLMFCHACSRKKSSGASLAPNKSKLYRVCDPCFIQLRKLAEFRQEAPSPRTPSVTRRVFPELKMSGNDKKYTDSQTISPTVANHGQLECFGDQTPSMKRRNQKPLEPVMPILQKQTRWGQVFFPVTPSKFSRENSMIVPVHKDGASITSAISIRRSPRLKSMVPSSTNLSKESVESKELLEELKRLRSEAKILTIQCKTRSEKIQLYQEKIEETRMQAREEVAKCKAAKEIIKVLTMRLNVMAEKFSTRETSNAGTFVSENIDESLPQITSMDSEYADLDMTSAYNTPRIAPHVRILKCGELNAANSLLTPTRDELTSKCSTGIDVTIPRGVNKQNVVKVLKTEWVEQDEPGVYITFMTLASGQKGLKRVRFSRKHFGEKKAEQWWEENHLRIYQKYDVDPSFSPNVNDLK